MRFKAFLLGFILSEIALFVGGFFFLFLAAPTFYNILIIGSDQRGTERARSDVLFMVSIPKDQDKNPLFLTIPRDTKIEHPEYGLQKITHFYALGDQPNDTKQLGNAALTEEVVEQLLDRKIDATIEVTFQSFEEIVDSLGGAALQGKIISGSEALAVVRDRFTQGRSDFDRQTDAHEIFRSLLTKIKEPTRITALLQYFKDADQARFTYNKPKLVRFLSGGAIARRGRVEIGAMQEEVVPGAGQRVYTPAFGKSLYYWVADEEALQRMLHDYFD